ncbi:hypothetical protein ACUOFC_63090, partial [Escherichia sp. TWPC-MK]
PGTKGRTLRYQRESLELFKLIAHLKDAQEPPDVIENVLKGTVNYIVIDEESVEWFTENNADYSAPAHFMKMFSEKLKSYQK